MNQKFKIMKKLTTILALFILVGLGYAQLVRPQTDWNKPKMNKEEAMQLAKELKATGQTSQMSSGQKSVVNTRMQVADYDEVFLDDIVITVEKASCDATPLPWTSNFATATAPQFPDCWERNPDPTGTSQAGSWRVGKVTDGVNLFPNVAGNDDPYAFILYNSVQHDAWVYTPGFDFVAGKTYVLSFYTQMQGWAGEFEELTVYAGTDKTAAGMTTKLWENKTQDFPTWTNIARAFTPTTSGTYYFGFHATSWDVNSILVDALSVFEQPTTPSFGGAPTLAFGNVFSNAGEAKYTRSYTITNNGAQPLTLTAGAMSPEITISGLQTIAPMGSQTITVTLDASALPNGAYTGNFALTTNDPNNTSVTINLTATVGIATIFSFINEDFNGDGFPDGWLTDVFHHYPAGGVGNSGVISTNLFDIMGWFGLYDGTVQTPYVAMGTNPTFSFMYKVNEWWSDIPTNPYDYAFVAYITDDFGATWNELFAVMPGESTQTTNGFVQVTHDVSAYANKTVMVQIVFFLTEDDADFDVFIDDVILGTPPNNDLAATSIIGTVFPIVDTETPYNITVKNIGINTQTASDYSVQLVQEGGTVIATLPGVNIVQNEVKTFEFIWTPSVTGETYIYGEVVFAADEFPGNNKTANLTVEVQDPGSLIVVVGTGTGTSNSMPMNFYYEQSMVQTLYFANEIGTNAATLNEIVYKSSLTSSDIVDKAIKVWVGETALTDLASDWINPSVLTLVFDGTMTFSAGNGLDVVIPFNAPYNYQGGNLVVYVFKDDDDYFGMTDQFFVTAYPGSNRSRTRAADAPTVLDALNPTAGGANNNIPNTILKMRVEDMGSVSGVVSDANGSLEGVKVLVQGTQLFAITDATGAYELPLLTEGNLNLVASIFGYYTQTVAITVIVDDVITQNITMVPWELYTVSGLVSGSDVATLADVEVKLSANVDGTAINFSATTDANGLFSIANVYDANTYNVEATLTDRMPYTGTVTVNGANVTDLNITLMEIIEDPFNLAVSMQGARATLTWNNANAGDNFFDDMESYTNFIIANIADYTLRNVNTSGTYGIDGVSFQNQNSAHAFMVFNPTATTPALAQGWEAFSGNKYLASFAKESGANNDWLILPKTTVASGTKFEFMAKSVTDEYGLERFRVAVSTTGTATTDFTNVLTSGTHVNAPTTWTKYSYDLSTFAGQDIRVAINCVSNDAFLFMVDDIFLGIPSRKDAKAFSGFTVYLDGEVKQTGIKGTEFTFTSLCNKQYTAGVEAVYTSGKSIKEEITFTVTTSAECGSGMEILTRDIFTVFPNPVKDLLHIETEKTIKQIEIVDVNGRVLRTWIGDNKTIDVQNIPTGNYVLRIHTDNAIVPIRIVKQ
jgi:hypothetical protein